MKKGCVIVVFLVLVVGCSLYAKSCVHKEMEAREQELSRLITPVEAMQLAHDLNTSRGKRVFDFEQDINPKDLLGLNTRQRYLITIDMWFTNDRYLYTSKKVGQVRGYTLGQQEAPLLIFEDFSGKGLLVWVALDCASTMRMYKEAMVSWRAGDRVFAVFDLKVEDKAKPLSDLKLPEGVQACEYSQE